MNGHRRAAVALRPLGIEDRQWILEALADHDREILLAYLAELNELGFTEEAGILNEDEFAVPPGPAEHTLLRNADALHVYEVLQQESAALIASLLATDTWPWTDAFLDKLDPHRRNQVLHCRYGMPPITPITPVTPAKTASLCRAIARRIGECRTASPSVKLQSGTGKVRANLARMIKRMVTAWPR